MAFHPLALAEKHPVETAAIVVVGGLAILYLLRGSNAGAANTSADASASAAYYAAQSSQAQAGDAVQIAQIQANSALGVASVNDAASVTEANTFSNAGVQENTNNNATAISLAPFAVQSQAVGALATAAAAPPVTTTTSSSSNGFFGIGGGSNTTTTVSPSPVATSAVDQLDALINGFNAGH